MQVQPIVSLIQKLSPFCFKCKQPSFFPRPLRAKTSVDDLPKQPSFFPRLLRAKTTVDTLYLVTELPEYLHIEWLKPVPVGVDEVEAAVHAVVHDVLAVEAALVAEVPLELEGLGVNISEIY